MKQYNQAEIINFLIDYQTSMQDDETLYYMLKNGCPGYENMPLQDIIEEFVNNILPEEKEFEVIAYGCDDPYCKVVWDYDEHGQIEIKSFPYLPNFYQKITHGWVSQVFSNGKCQRQEFHCGDQVEYIDMFDDDLKDLKRNIATQIEEPFPFNMEQPKGK